MTSIPEIYQEHPVIYRELTAIAPFPHLFVAGGPHAGRMFLRFFAATIRNRNTRRAYYHAACSFAEWCEAAFGLSDLRRIEPEHVSAYAELWQTTHALPTIKLHLAALRRLFDWLVLQRVVDSNPAQVVRGPSYSARRGKAPVLDAEEVRVLFDSIETQTLIGLRDRALMAVMVYSFSRIGAATKMKLKDVFVEGKHAFIRLHEKRGKRRELPTHQALHGHLSAYIKAAGLDDEEAPLFRSFKRATLTKRQLQTSQANGLGQAGIYELLREHMTPRPMSQADAYRMIRRRAAAAGLKTKLGNHSWRATGITTYLNNGGTLEKAQGIAGHASMDTTRLYDRREEADTRKEIARIRF